LDTQARKGRLGRLRTEVEKFALRVLDEVANNATVRTFSNHSMRIEIIRCAEKEKAWIRSPEAKQVTDAKNFSEHLTAAKKCIAPVYRRMLENQTLWMEAGKLYNTLSMAKQLIEKWKGYGNPADAKDIAVFERLTEKNFKWFNETFPVAIHAPPHEPPPVKPKVFHEKCLEFEIPLNQMKDKYGAGGPTLMKRDGTRASAEEADSVMGRDFLRKMQQGMRAQEGDEDQL
jgi:hypothetical protein